MQLDLTPEQSSLIDFAVQGGRYRNREEAVHAALAEWERREHARLELLSSFDQAERDLEAGEGQEYTPETLHQLTASVVERGRARLASR